MKRYASSSVELEELSGLSFVNMWVYFSSLHGNQQQNWPNLATCSEAGPHISVMSPAVGNSVEQSSGKTPKNPSRAGPQIQLSCALRVQQLSPAYHVHFGGKCCLAQPAPSLAREIPKNSYQFGPQTQLSCASAGAATWSDLIWPPHVSPLFPPTPTDPGSWVC